MSELAALPPPSVSSLGQPGRDASSSKPESGSSSKFQFRYPTTLVPIPYYANLTLQQLADELIPHTRQARQITISIPVQPAAGVQDMMLDESVQVKLQHTAAPISPDGMLLYVAHASYEPGTSPLSMWVPIRAYSEGKMDGESVVHAASAPQESPLGVFER